MATLFLVLLTILGELLLVSNLRSVLMDSVLHDFPLSSPPSDTVFIHLIWVECLSSTRYLYEGMDVQSILCPRSKLVPGTLHILQNGLVNEQVNVIISGSHTTIDNSQINPQERHELM